MKIAKVKYFMIFILVLLLCSNWQVTFAQPGDPGGDPDARVPISGIEWLLIGGGIFGARKIFQKYRTDHKQH
jgi:hypothetical protein